MSERYKQLFSLTNNLYAETSPVVIAAGSLLKDTATGKILAQIKFQNITSKPIKALRVSIAPRDTRGEGLGEPIEHTYLDLSAERGDEFGQKVPVLLPDDETRAFYAAVTEVIFSDNTVWTAGGGEWMPIPPRQPLAVLLEDQELEKQFRLTYGENCRFRPVEYKDLWFCACGSLNTEADVLCAGCRAPKAAMVAPDIAALTAERDKRLAAEAEEKAAAEARAKKRKKMVAIILPIVFVVVVAWILVTQVFLPAKNYEAAEALMETGEYTAAMEAFKALGDYKDSTDKAAEAKLKSAEVGDYVYFGSYEQDDNTANGKEDIEWLVLDVQDGKALLISKYALDCQRYNEEYEGVTWENCTLRKWLNDEFLNAAFSAEEQAFIPAVTLSADKNPNYNTAPGNDTQDQVFLLSILEAEEYFASDNARQCAPTDYAVANGAYVDSDNGNCCWCLRSPGSNQDDAVYVSRDGGVRDYGCDVDCSNYAVRPALWIDLNS